MTDLHPDLTRQQRALEWAVALATAPVPGGGEQLATYVQQLPEQPWPAQEPGVYHLLYCSQAVHAFGEEQLADLLEASLAWNAQSGITGLLCYGNGHFVQVLEGAATDVEELFARIRRDRRHHHVHILSRGVGEARQFDGWRMAFTKAHTHEFYWLITFLEAHHHRLLLRQVPVTEPQLTTTLQNLSNSCSSAPGEQSL